MNLIAHRGLHSKNTKENTLEAIELGNKHVDIDGVEIDVRLSKDNKVVVIHDEYIDVVSNGRGRTNEMSLERLKRFNYGTVVKPSTINSLSEVLDKISPQTLLIIELKDEREKNDILASKVIEIVNNYPLLNIWLKSFSLDIVNYLKRYSNRPVGILINEFNKDLITRIKDTKPQYKLKRNERLVNLSSAFKVTKENYKGKTVLLIDDICTTGATFEEMIKELTKNGITNIVCLAATTPFEN